MHKIVYAYWIYIAIPCVHRDQCQQVQYPKVESSELNTFSKTRRGLVKPLKCTEILIHARAHQACASWSKLFKMKQATCSISVIALGIPPGGAHVISNWLVDSYFRYFQLLHESYRQRRLVFLWLNRWSNAARLELLFSPFYLLFSFMCLLLHILS